MGNFGDKLRQRREERKQTREQSKSTRREQRAGSNQPRQPRYGAGIFKGSLGEPNREPITQKNEDGIEVIPTDANNPDGYTEDTSAPSVAMVDKSQYTTNQAQGLDDPRGGGTVDKLKHQSTSAMSSDGLLLPMSTTFVERKPEGQGAEYADPQGGTGRPGINQNRLPPYEKPSRLIEWWHVGSGVVTSATLNPFAKGHHIAVVNRGSQPGNVDVRADEGGHGEDEPALGKINTRPQGAARPMSLRGPLVITGWGYDLEANPVPNKKFDAEFKNTSSRSKDYGKPVGLPDYLEEDKPQKHFLSGHLSRIDKWKTGPVDLRWDTDRKVWTAPGENKVYLSKAARCILPTVGEDGRNSWNFGVGNTTGGGRVYRNPCPSKQCKYDTYFPKSKYYPDIEIYDPEDSQWCGKCQVKKGPAGPYVACEDPTTACVPFYDAIILRSMGHVVSGRNVRSDCGDKFSKTMASDPFSRRIGTPCHGWGSSYDGKFEYLQDKLEGVNEADEEYSHRALSVLYQRIIIENPLNQGLMLGDSFLSYDTGRRVTVSYMRSKNGAGCGAGGEAIRVSESIPVHVILQGEFMGVEMVTNAHCEAGEYGACTRKVMVQGMTTTKDCGPDDNYPASSLG